MKEVEIPSGPYAFTEEEKAYRLTMVNGIRERVQKHCKDEALTEFVCEISKLVTDATLTWQGNRMAEECLKWITENVSAGVASEFNREMEAKYEQSRL